MYGEISICTQLKPKCVRSSMSISCRKNQMQPYNSHQTTQWCVFIWCTSAWSDHFKSIELNAQSRQVLYSFLLNKKEASDFLHICTRHVFIFNAHFHRELMKHSTELVRYMFTSCKHRWVVFWHSNSRNFFLFVRQFKFCLCTAQT